MERLHYVLGLLTLAGAVVAGWFLMSLLGETDREQSFRLRLEFRTARGLRSGADVRLRGVPVGTVRQVRVGEGGRKAVVEISLQPWAEEYACVNSRFWIVAPRFSGLGSGATGLDTLVRDAYIAFVTPEPSGPQLPSGHQLPGLERPDPDGGEAVLDPIQRGDLLMSVLMPENHGLTPGSRVMFRGMLTGDVRDVRLAPDGSYVEVELRIYRIYRNTVTDRSRFWIARPRLEGALLGGFALEDLSAFLSPFVAYYGEPDAGLPVTDGYRALGSPVRPEGEVAMVPDSALGKDSVRTPVAPGADSIHLVRVAYEAIEVDFLSANDEIKRQGSGVLYADRSGRTVVLTARSVCDGSYFESDGIFAGDPDIESEEIRVLLPEGRVSRASRIWVDPGGSDLALLVLVPEEAALDIAVTPADRLAFDEQAIGRDQTLELRVSNDSSGPIEPLKLEEGSALPDLQVYRGGLVLQAGTGVGILGQRTGEDPEPTLVPISPLPDALRPRQ